MINKSKFIMIVCCNDRNHIASVRPVIQSGDGTGNVLPALMDARRNRLYDYAPNSVRNALGHKEKLRIR